VTPSETSGRDLPGRVLAAVVRALPADRRDWGAALRAEQAMVVARSDRWGYTRAAVRVATTRNPALRAALHLGAVLATSATVLAWAATVDYPPLLWGLDAVVATLAAVSWQARRTAMLGPVGTDATAWLLRAGGYLTAAAIAAVAVAHAHPVTASAADSAAADGTGMLVFAVTGASYVLAAATLRARRSAATPRVLATGAACGLAAAVAWLATTVLAPPVPPTAGWAVTLCGLAAVAAATATGTRHGPRHATRRRIVLAALLAAAAASALIFTTVCLLARYGPDTLIPAITPHALPADRVSESRIELVDPYIRVLVLGTLTATALGVAGVVTRRRLPRRVPIGL
jgi:hypothetical protein